jgi:hypothetical protein
MLEKDRLMIKLLHLGYLVHIRTKYCVFIRFSGHIDQVELQVCESKEKWRNELFTGQVQTEFNKLFESEESHLAGLKARVLILERILEDEEIPYEEMDYEEEYVRRYSF